ncbi:MAG: right-handed parallel beta-helix repeat-containing protein, partial [Candidatus Eisenbacteria bacterium]
AEARNSTLFENAAALGGGLFLDDPYQADGSFVLENCIIAFSTDGGAVYGSSGVNSDSLFVGCTDIYGNAEGDWVWCFSGWDTLNDNMNVDPLFCDTAMTDLTLDERSPCAAWNAPGCGLLGAQPVRCGPEIYLEEHSVGLVVAEGGAGCDSIAIWNLGDKELHWTASAACGWVTALPDSGALPGDDSVVVRVCADASSLSPGIHSCTLLVASDDHDRPEDTVFVSLTVVGAPDIGVDPSALVFESAVGETACVSLTLSNTGLGDLEWLAREEEGTLVLKNGSVFATRMRGTAFASDHAAEPPKGADEPRAAKTASSRRSGGPDTFGYRWIDSDEPGGPGFTWEDISSGGTSPSLGDDDYVEIPLSFDFPFYGVAYASLKISSNGYLTFGPDGTDYSNDSIPCTQDPDALVAVFWDDLDPTLGGSVHYHSAPDQVIVQYEDVQRYGGSDPYTFQVVLYENGSIDFRYLVMYGPVDGATIGIEGPYGIVGLPVAYNTAYLHHNLRVRIEDAFPWLTELPPGGVVDPSDSQAVEVCVDATALGVGSYEGILVVESNDPDEPEVVIPLTISVRGNRAWRVPGDAPTIAAGIDSAVAGDTVLVEPETYYENDIPMKSGVVLVSESGRAETVIDANGAGKAFLIQNVDSTGVIRGFTITNGEWWADGGAMFVDHSDLRIEDCLITNGHSTDGAGIYLYYSSPTIFGCTFAGNSADDDGGAVHCNRSSPRILHSTFSGNGAPDGGAVYSRSSSAPLIENTIVAYNTGGSGIECETGSGGSATLVCSDVFGNAGGDWVGCIAGQEGTNGNLSLDPLFCGDETPEAPWMLDEASPCAAGNNPGCGQIGAWAVGCSVATSVAAAPAPPEAFRLHANVPNPFNPLTTIRYDLPFASRVTLRVYDVAGRATRTLIEGAPESPGYRSVLWDGTDDFGRPVGSGIYFYRLEAGEYRGTRRMVLLK